MNAIKEAKRARKQNDEKKKVLVRGLNQGADIVKQLLVNYLNSNREESDLNLLLGQLIINQDKDGKFIFLRGQGVNIDQPKQQKTK